MKERSDLIEFLRGEVVGPARAVSAPTRIMFQESIFVDSLPQRRGALVWQPLGEEELHEVLYFQRENPYRKYGAGVLHPPARQMTDGQDDDAAVTAAAAADAVGVDETGPVPATSSASESDDGESSSGDDAEAAEAEDGRGAELEDDFEVTSPDIRRPSTIGVSFCAKLSHQGQVVVRLPRGRRFAWQQPESPELQLNGRYEKCDRSWTDGDGRRKRSEMWRRLPAVPLDTKVVFTLEEIVRSGTVFKEVTTSDPGRLSLQADLFARRMANQEDVWLVTVVLRNTSASGGDSDPRASTLYQTFFEVRIEGGALLKYPESQRPFEMLDSDEQSLALLYRESATWGIGHGCAAGWDAEPGQAPDTVYAEVMPAVELPSMTPDIRDEDGKPIQLSMRALSGLTAPQAGDPVWAGLSGLVDGYARWIPTRGGVALWPRLRVGGACRHKPSTRSHCSGRAPSHIRPAGNGLRPL